MPIIEIKDLTFTYANSQKPSLIDINLKIEKGDFVLLTGPTGCGKTTLCRCLNGLIPHFHSGTLTGEVIVDGLKVADHPVYELADKVGLVFQNPENQLVSLNVARELAFAPENFGLPRPEIIKRVEETLDMMGIRHLKDKPPYELSGGEQQRVAIASLLTLKPKVLVLDEPTSNLDPKSAKHIISLIARLNKELGITIILIEHRLEMVTEYVNRAILMKNGKIILDGEPKYVLSSKEAENIGVGIPKIIQLFKKLKARNIPITQIPLTVEEAKDIILKDVVKYDTD
ncbi:MAG: energy-coupling factor ABC transporter ATP-binding protein [Candidatus Odinarchaeia archaeon]